MDRRKIKLAQERAAKEYFIDPYGKVKKWKGPLKDLAEYSSTHAKIACKILGTSTGKETDKLHKLGWISIGSVAYGNRIKNEPNQAQINTLVDMGVWQIRDDSGRVYNFT